MKKSKLTKKQIVAISVAGGVLLLWLVSYMCIKAAMESQLEKMIEKQTSLPSDIDISSDMFSIIGGNVRKVKADIKTDNGNGYCRISLKKVRLNLKDKSKNKIGSADIDVKVSEKTLEGYLAKAFSDQLSDLRASLTMQNGYVYLQQSGFTSTGVLQAANSSVYLRIIDTNAGIDPKIMDQKINPVFTNNNISFTKLEYSGGFYLIKANLTAPDGLPSF